MRFGFKELEHVLAMANAIPADRRTQFAARLRNLFRVGLALPGGRVGKRTNYGPEDLLKMALAVELMQVGLLPEKVPDAVTTYWPIFRKFIAAARIDNKERGPSPGYLILQPGYLTENGFDPKIFAWVDHSVKSLPDIVGGYRRAIAIDVSSVWEAIEISLEGAGLSREQFSLALGENDPLYLQVDE